MVVYAWGWRCKTRTRVICALLAVACYTSFFASSYRSLVLARVKYPSRVQEALKTVPDVRLGLQPTSSYETSKLALMVEPRPIPHLVPLILHMIAVVPSDWRFLFIGSHQSVFTVGKSFSIKHYQVTGKLDLMELPQPWSIDGTENVSRTLTDERFYDEFLPGVEWILKYDHDNILCANSETSLDDWLDWNWAWSARVADNPFSRGGLTLRRVSKVKHILGFQKRRNDTEPEDEWFGSRMAALSREKVASRFDGAFAAETLFADKPIGYNTRSTGAIVEHRSWKSSDARRQILDYCPELSMVMGMRLEQNICSDGQSGDGMVSVKAQIEAQSAMKELQELQEVQRHAQTMADVMPKAQVVASAQIKSTAGGPLLLLPPPLPPLNSKGLVNKIPPR